MSFPISASTSSRDNILDQLLATAPFWEGAPEVPCPAELRTAEGFDLSCVDFFEAMKVLGFPRERLEPVLLKPYLRAERNYLRYDVRLLYAIKHGLVPENIDSRKLEEAQKMWRALSAEALPTTDVETPVPYMLTSNACRDPVSVPKFRAMAEAKLFLRDRLAKRILTADDREIQDGFAFRAVAGWNWKPWKKCPELVPANCFKGRIAPMKNGMSVEERRRQLVEAAKLTPKEIGIHLFPIVICPEESLQVRYQPKPPSRRSFWYREWLWRTDTPNPDPITRALRSRLRTDPEIVEWCRKLEKAAGVCLLKVLNTELFSEEKGSLRRERTEDTEFLWAFLRYGPKRIVDLVAKA